MPIILAVLLSFLQLNSFTDSTDLSTESKSQAEYYIDQIERKNNIEENLWALTLLGSENNELKSFIENKSQSLQILQPFLKFEDNFQQQIRKVVFQTGSMNLLVALLLSTEDENKKRKILTAFISKFKISASQDVKYKKLFEAIINKKKINGDILTDKKFLLLHFFLLFDENNATFFSDSYLQKIKKNWTSNSNHNLHITLKSFSYFRVLYLTDRYSQTASLYDDLINSDFFPNSFLKLRFYRYLDYAMYRLGYYDRSLKIERNLTEPLAKKYGPEKLLFSIKISKGTTLYRIGKIKEAQSIFEGIVADARKKEINLPETIIYNNLALAYFKLGQTNKYLDLQFQALNIAQERKNYGHQIEIYNNLFIYYRKSKDQQNALSYLDKAQNLAKEENNASDLGTIYVLTGSFLREFKNNYNKAHKYFAEAKEILSPKNHFRQYITLLNEQAETYSQQQKFKNAIEIHEEILTLISGKDNPNYTDAYINKALNYIRLDNLEKAKQTITEFKSNDLNQLDFEQVIKAKTVEANYLQRTGNSYEAINILEPALDQIVERAKSSADLKTGFWHVEDEFLNAFELAVSIYQKIGQPEQAIQKLDQFKTINDASLYQNPLVKSSLLNESELTQYKQLTDQLDATRKKLLTASEDRQFDIRQTISQLNVKKRKLDQKLTKQIDSNPISVREIQNHLSARELVLHITELNDQYYIAKISRSDVSINTIPLDTKFRNLLSNAAQQIATNETNLDSLYKISQTLNLQEISDHVEQITLIPDSYFYQLPIDILPLEKPTTSYSYGEASYVIEEFTTQYLTSLEDYKSNSAERSSSQNNISYTGYGVSNFNGYNNESLVSLPFAQTEISNIANKLTHLPNVQTFLNEQSTKTAFKQTAPESQIIHLATHSEVSERDPMFSTIYMSNTGISADSTFDSQIFAYELFELDLSNEMIMLNSCESGSGSYIQGTGVMGMSRALQYAGANSLVLNLWSVNDMLASDFAIHFYDQLNQGKSKAEALRDTKRYFLQNKNASPHFWGPYMLIGNPDPIVQPDKDKNMAMAGTFIFYFLLMVSLSYLAQRGYIFKNKDMKAA